MLWSAIPDPCAALRPDLVLRDFEHDPVAMDARWCGDITYVPTEEGWLFLATIIDIASPPTICGPNWSPTPREP
ncbi:hypothetical protein [Streptomyces sp. LS1784]|uniref:hypothetical protein n=1 Tax=Streptomyces sp. LS1784 TaxID=2851533 RepID=UPI0035A89A97